MPPKRKVKDAALDEPKDAPRRTSRRINPTGVKDEAKDATTAFDSPPTKKSTSKSGKPNKDKKEKVKSEEVEEEKEEKKSKATKSAKPAKASKPNTKATNKDDEAAPTGRQYWLMKAEPESRIEKGHDIKFSIDDLAAKTLPEPWDGIRNYAARNNLRAMKKGDLAFFYHSSCKIPAIVGVMEIVEEATPDLSAHDSSLPYYDPNSKPTDPKWSVVHVEFRQKLKTPITLKELREWYAVKDHVLAGMQMLKLARMSVSKVSAGEWGFLVGEMKSRGDVVEG